MASFNHKENEGFQSRKLSGAHDLVLLVGYQIRIMTVIMNSLSVLLELFKPIIV